MAWVMYLLRRSRALDVVEEEVLDTVAGLVEMVRDKYFDDVYQFMSNGYSVHDCYEINSELLKLMKLHGIEGRIVKLRDLKHYVVEFRINNEYYYADAVPELSGVFSEILSSGFTGSAREALGFYKIIQTQ